MSKEDDTKILKTLVDEDDKKKGAKLTQPLFNNTQQDDTQIIAKAAKSVPNTQIKQQKLAKRAQAANASGTTPQQAPDDDDETDLSGAELRARYRFSKEVDADRKAAEDEAAGIENVSGAELRARARYNKELANDKSLAARRNISRITRITQTAGDAINPILDNVSAAKTPGGIGALIVILGILLIVLVRVNMSGDTRLKQLWYMMGGQASLKGRVSVVGNQPNHNGGSDFGNGSGGSGNGGNGGGGNQPIPIQQQPGPPPWLGTPTGTFGDPTSGIGTGRINPLSGIGF